MESVEKPEESMRQPKRRHCSLGLARLNGSLRQENIVAMGKGELQTSKHNQCNLPPNSSAYASPDTSYDIAANAFPTYWAEPPTTTTAPTPTLPQPRRRSYAYVSVNSAASTFTDKSSNSAAYASPTSHTPPAKSPQRRVLHFPRHFPNTTAYASNS